LAGVESRNCNQCRTEQEKHEGIPMFVLHCTKKAQDRLKTKPVDSLAEPTTRLGNWYCHEFTASRRKYMMFVNERTLLSIIISVKGLKTSDSILEFFKQRFFKTFLLLQWHEDNFMSELEEMDEVVFAKTANRSVLGSMNDLIAQAKFASRYHDMAVDSPAMFEFLAQMPLGGTKYQVTLNLVSELLDS
jgi:hypothetical protein